MASHLHHVDAVGIGIVDEREHRPEPAKTSVTLAHVARIISDCNVYSFMRLITAYLCAGEDTKWFMTYGIVMRIDSAIWREHKRSGRTSDLPESNSSPSRASASHDRAILFP